MSKDEHDTVVSLEEEGFLDTQSQFAVNLELEDALSDRDAPTAMSDSQEGQEEHRQGDLIDLRGLFDEDFDENDSANDDDLGFEEIPDDIDIDEPVEVEELSRTGRILDTVVKAALFIFFLLVVAFIINAGLVIAAIHYHSHQIPTSTNVYVDIASLDEKEATVNVTIRTRAIPLGRFVVGELDTRQLTRALIFLKDEDAGEDAAEADDSQSNNEEPRPEDLLFEVAYQNEDEKPLIYRASVDQVFYLENIKMRLNPNFDTSRLSGFMEPKIDGKRHKRCPQRLLTQIDLNVVAHSLWIPIPYYFKDTFITSFDAPEDENAAKKMASFDWMPRFISVKAGKASTDSNIYLKIRQPVPKFFAPKNLELSAHMPSMKFKVHQFTMTDPNEVLDIAAQRAESNYLTTVAMSDFRLNFLHDSLTPNFIDIDATISKDSLEGLKNVLKALRDGTQKNLAFLFLHHSFQKHEPSDVELFKEKDRNQWTLQENQFLIPFSDFMKSFWGRMAYPASSGARMTGCPELYRKGLDPAVKLRFLPATLSQKALTFEFDINVHYLVSLTKLPLLMLRGKIPNLHYNLIVNDTIEVAKISILHQDLSAIQNDYDQLAVVPKELKFIVSLEITKFEGLLGALQKLSRLSEFHQLTRDLNQELLKKVPITQIIGLDVNEIELRAAIQPALLKPEVKDDAKLSASLIKAKLLQGILSIFNVKIQLTGDRPEILYAHTGNPVIPEPTKEALLAAVPTFSEEKDMELVAKLNSVLGLKSVSPENYDATLHTAVDQLKRRAYQADKEASQASMSIEDLSLHAKVFHENEVRELRKRKRTGVLDGRKHREDVEEDSREKLMEVRRLLEDRQELHEALYVSYGQLHNDVVVNVSSFPKKMSSGIFVNLHHLNKVYDDIFLLEWDSFIFSIGKKSDESLIDVLFSKGEVAIITSKTQTRIFRQNESNVPYNVSLDVRLNSQEKDVKAYFETLKAFAKEFKTTSNESPVKFFVLFKATDGSVGLQLPVSTPSTKLVSIVEYVDSLPWNRMPKLNVKPQPTFFDNFAKSRFDFVGYGVFRLLFHAILPNPDHCPGLKDPSNLATIVSRSAKAFSGASNCSDVFNVEINLPETSALISAQSARIRELSVPGCLAAVSVPRPLRIWTQIVDGVLCNMYTVAEGIDEQRELIHARLPSSQTKSIIAHFAKVIKISESKTVSETKKRKPAKKEDDLKERVANADIDIDEDYAEAKAQEPGADIKYKFALLKAIPVSLSILNFDRLIKSVDAMSQKHNVDIFTNNYYSDSIPSTSEFFNQLISSLGSLFPVSTNPARPDPIFKEPLVIDEKSLLRLGVKAASATPSHMDVKVYFKREERADSDSEENDHDEEEKDDASKSSSRAELFESLAFDERFKFPIIRWGKTELCFAFSKFFVKVSLKAGEMEIQNDGKIIFEGLNDYEIGITVVGRDLSKSKRGSWNVLADAQQLFTVSGLRQFFKECAKYVDEPDGYEFDSKRVIKTACRVSYGPEVHKNFDYYGAADTQSFLILQAVIIRRMFPKKPDIVEAADAVEDEEDPTKMNFAMTVELANKNSTSTLKTPCVFTNLCSDRMLSDTSPGSVKLDESIDLNLKIHDTFQPLTAGIAAGFAMVLSIFHFDSYPRDLQWILEIPADQVIGMEFNGIGMVYGKAGPLDIVKTARIPYPDAFENIYSSDNESENSSASGNDFKMNTDYVGPDRMEGVRSHATRAAGQSFEEFSKNFFSDYKPPKPKDTVVIPIKAQIPQTLHLALRTMLSAFLYPANVGTVTLHPPLFPNSGGRQIIVLRHPSMSFGMSDHNVAYKMSRGKEIKTSLLSTIFAAFIEESSAGELNAHQISSMKSEMLCHTEYVSQGYSISTSIRYKLLIEMPWGMNPIWLQLPTPINVWITDSVNRYELVHLKILKMSLIGKIGKLHMDLTANIYQFFNNHNDLKVSMRFGDALIYETELNLKKLFISLGPISVGSLVSMVYSFLSSLATRAPPDEFETLSKSFFFNNEKLLKAYRTRAPQSLICCPGTAASSQLSVDLHNTRIYFDVNASIKANRKFNIFAQLRDKAFAAVCGKKGNLAIKLEYIRNQQPLEILVDDEMVVKPAPIYIEAEFNKDVSVYYKSGVKLPFSGRYRVYVAFNNERDLKKLKYTEIKYTEIFVQHERFKN